MQPPSKSGCARRLGLIAFARPVQAAELAWLHCATGRVQPTLERRVSSFLERYLGLLAAIAEGRHPELIVFSDVLTLADPQHGAVAAAYNQMFRRVRVLLDASDAPPLQPAARNARAHLLLSSTNWARAWLMRYESTDYPRVAARLADLLLHGLCARSARH